MTSKKTKARKTPNAKIAADASTPDQLYAEALAELLSGNEYVLIGQRTCGPDGKSHSGFQYPTRGWVACEDWDKGARCGEGLHFCAVGAVGGEVIRDSGLTIIADEPNRRWQIVLAKASECVRIDEEKHKAPRLFVVELDGTKDAMGAWLADRGIVGHYMVTAGGYGSTNTGGYRSTNTGGYVSTNTGGDRSTNTGGYRSTNTGGNRSRSMVGNDSTVKTGENGVVVMTWFDINGKQQVKAWTVGKNRDLKANTAYRVVDGVATEVM